MRDRYGVGRKKATDAEDFWSIMYNITFQQIEAFLIVSKHLNLSKAAEAMFITQSALSKTLQRFEEGVDMQLFVRSNKGLTLTNEGKYLYSTLESLYSNMNKTIKAARNISGEYVKTLRIVAPSSFDAAGDFDRLKGLVRLYQNRYPDVVMLETLCDFKELRQAIEFEEADLVFAQDFSLTGIPDIQYKRISRFRLYLAMTIDHPLAQSEFVFNMRTLEALSQEVFYTVPIPKEPSILSNTLDKCRGIGFLPKKLEFVSNFQTLVHYIRKGKGMGICGRFDHLGYSDIKYIPIPEAVDDSYVVVAWRANGLTGEARDFVDLISPKNTGEDS